MGTLEHCQSYKLWQSHILRWTGKCISQEIKYIFRPLDLLKKKKKSTSVSNFFEGTEGIQFSWVNRLTLSAGLPSVQFSSVQSLSRVWLFATPWIAARQAPLSITNSRSSLRLTSIESMMPSSHLFLCHPLLLLPPIPPSIRVFSNESTLRMR